MRVIDANSGTELYVGKTFRNVNGVHEVVEIKPGIFNAKIRLITATPNGGLDRWVPLQVRWLHPSFLFQHVAFVPS